MVEGVSQGTNMSDQNARDKPIIIYIRLTQEQEVLKTRLNCLAHDARKSLNGYITSVLKEHIEGFDK
jgi:hypothetical protein